MCIEKQIQKHIAPIINLGNLWGNAVYMKREDLIPVSFGGNKARKAFYFFKEIDEGYYDCVVTYGSSHSNHCRIVANMAAARGMKCTLIGPKEVSEETFNSKLMNILGAESILVPVDQVHDCIEETLKKLRMNGKRPYFIPGGGHGNLGTQAYLSCYEEIVSYERKKDIFFDYIFLASGTGTTQAGLIAGQLLDKSARKIVGVSVARKMERGKSVVVDSVKSYLPTFTIDQIRENTIFVDEYIGTGYGNSNREIDKIIKNIFTMYGIPLDSTYTGKAFWGMEKYLEKEAVKNKNILFIHTGGTPLFFDDLKRMKIDD